MKKFMCLIVLLISLTSCGSTTYFYSTLNSDSPNTLKDDEGYFFTEKDSLEVSYSFNGENAPIVISIYNKGHLPAYIDWNQSVLLINGTKNTYSDVIMSLDSDIESDLSYENENYDNISYNISLIPPLAIMNYQALGFSNLGLEFIDDKRYKDKKIGDKNGNIANIKTLNFSRSDSPFKFQSSLTLYKEVQSPLIVNHEFYISGLIKTKDIAPSAMHASLIDRGDVFYSKIVKESQAGNIALGTLLVGLLVLDAATHYSEDDCCN